jgi:hypothetical protein
MRKKLTVHERGKTVPKIYYQNGIQGPNTTTYMSPRRKIITPSVLNTLTNALVLILSDQDLSSIGAFLLEE